MALRDDVIRHPAAQTEPTGVWGNDPDAFEAFYREHVDAVERFVARRVADRELAADLTADVFIAAIESAASSIRAGFTAGVAVWDRPAGGGVATAS